MGVDSSDQLDVSEKRNLRLSAVFKEQDRLRCSLSSNPSAQKRESFNLKPLTEDSYLNSKAIGSVKKKLSHASRRSAGRSDKQGEEQSPDQLQFNQLISMDNSIKDEEEAK